MSLSVAWLRISPLAPRPPGNQFVRFPRFAGPPSATGIFEAISIAASKGNPGNGGWIHNKEGLEGARISAPWDVSAERLFLGRRGYEAYRTSEQA
jgi:hypothetical protein